MLLLNGQRVAIIKPIKRINFTDQHFVKTTILGGKIKKLFKLVKIMSINLKRVDFIGQIIRSDENEGPLHSRRVSKLDFSKATLESKPNQ